MVFFAVSDILPGLDIFLIFIDVQLVSVTVNGFQPAFGIDNHQLAVNRLAQIGNQLIIVCQIFTVELFLHRFQPFLYPFNRHLGIISLQDKDLDNPHQDDRKDDKSHHDEPETRHHAGKKAVLFFILCTQIYIRLPTQSESASGGLPDALSEI